LALCPFDGFLSGVPLGWWPFLHNLPASGFALFGCFSGTMPPSDSRFVSASILRVLSFIDAALLPFASGQGSCRVSRFPRKELPHMPGFSDSAEPFVPRLDRYVRCCFPLR
jgi:hypothetical protein